MILTAESCLEDVARPNTLNDDALGTPEDAPIEVAHLDSLPAPDSAAGAGRNSRTLTPPTSYCPQRTSAPSSRRRHQRACACPCTRRTHSASSSSILARLLLICTHHRRPVLLRSAAPHRPRLCSSRPPRPRHDRPCAAPIARSTSSPGPAACGRISDVLGALLVQTDSPRRGAPACGERLALAPPRQRHTVGADAAPTSNSKARACAAAPPADSAQNRKQFVRYCRCCLRARQWRRRARSSHASAANGPRSAVRAQQVRRATRAHATPRRLHGPRRPASVFLST
jgi:hypothetical protein